VDQSAAFVDVLTRVGLELPNKLGDCELGWNAQEQVYTVIEATDLNRKTVQIFGCSCHIRKNIVPKTIGEPSLAVLGAEDDVVEQLLMRAHGISLKSELIVYGKQFSTT
jgi:hypothetical protein